MSKSHYEKNKKEILKRLNERYRTDKAFREKAQKTYRERYQTDKDYKKTTLQNALTRYHTDSEYRRKTIERSRQRAKKLKQQKKVLKNKKPKRG